MFSFFWKLTLWKFTNYSLERISISCFRECIQQCTSNGINVCWKWFLLNYHPCWTPFGSVLTFRPHWTDPTIPAAVQFMVATVQNEKRNYMKILTSLFKYCNFYPVAKDRRIYRTKHKLLPTVSWITRVRPEGETRLHTNNYIILV